MDAPNTIFVVDANAVSRHALWLQLMHPKRSFRLFADARSALAAMEAETPSLVVADLDLPDRDGVAFLAEVARRHPLTRTVLIVGTETPVGARLARQDRIIDEIVGRPVDALDYAVRRLLREGWSEWLPVAV